MQRFTSFAGKKLAVTLSATLITVLLSACSTPANQGSAMDDQTANAQAKNAEANQGQTSAVDTASVETSSVPESNLADTSAADANASSHALVDKSLLNKNSVYFDYDSFTVKDEDQPLLETHAANITETHPAKIAIEGNTDKNGGREYNIALGQRRAESVRHKLLLLGVSGDQMEAVSFGKEKADGNDAQNRRADINYR